MHINISRLTFNIYTIIDTIICTSNIPEQRKKLRSRVKTGHRINFAGEIKTSRNTKRPIKKSDLGKREREPTRRSQRLRKLDEEQTSNSVNYLEIFHGTQLFMKFTNLILK